MQTNTIPTCFRVSSLQLATFFGSAIWVIVTCASCFDATAEEVHDLAKKGDRARLEQLLATNIAVLELRDSNGNAPLHLAAGRGNNEVIVLLLDRGASLAATNRSEGLSPLHSAARRGRYAAVKLMVDRGADINASDLHGCRPLHSAVYGGHGEVVELLLDQGAAVDAARSPGVTPLYYAASSGNTNLVAILTRHGARPDALPGRKTSPLHIAAARGHVAVVDLLVKAGASVDAENKDGQTPLHIAAKAGQFAMAECLLAQGADADAKDRLRFKPFDYVRGATNDVLAALLQRHMKSRLDRGLPVKVGEAGDPDRLQFSGLQTFTAKQIRGALARRPGYLLEAHPQASMNAYLESLKAMLESGYQAAGFPDVEADVDYVEAERIVRVDVREGSRFAAAGIHVSGASPTLEAKLIEWFTLPANTPNLVQPITSTSTQKEVSNPESGVTMDMRASAAVNVVHRPGGLDTPCKVSRPDKPMWVAGKPANFSTAFATGAVQQVESCLAEQGFFFPKSTIEIQRNAATDTADLLITLVDPGPPGIVGEITVTGTQRHEPGDIIQFLDLHEGSSLTAERLAEARQKLNDCGRFWSFEIMPVYPGPNAPARRHVDLSIKVEEQEGVPVLGEPLPPVQEAVLRLCRWLEDFPSRDEDVQVVFTNDVEFPFAIALTISPGHGFLFNIDTLQSESPLSAGFLLAKDTVQLCSWDSGRSLAAPRTGQVEVFLHLLPKQGEGSNRFNVSLGAGYKSGSGDGLQNPVNLDVRLSRAAFLDFSTREGGGGSIAEGMLVLTNKGFVLRANAATGEPDELVYTSTNATIPIRFGGQLWEPARSEFLQRSAILTNRYIRGRGLSSLLAFVVTEAAQYDFKAEGSPSLTLSERRKAASALNKLLDTDVLRSVDRVFGPSETNGFWVPMNEVDMAVAQNSMLALFSGVAFQYSDELFPKYSWPWTAARESVFILMSQGRYTDAELERLYNSEDTGPIGCLALARLLSAAGSPSSKTFALHGLMRLGATDFLRDCNLFLDGESGLARSFGQVTAVLRDLPDDEVAALMAVLPEAEARLLQQSVAALRSQPEAPPAVALDPALRAYWEGSLRAKVRQALRQLTAPRTRSGEGDAATLPPGSFPGKKRSPLASLDESIEFIDLPRDMRRAKPCA